jgi:hypothetical protein
MSFEVGKRVLRTLTVRELISILSDQRMDDPVVFAYPANDRVGRTLADPVSDIFYQDIWWCEGFRTFQTSDEAPGHEETIKAVVIS